MKDPPLDDLRPLLDHWLQLESIAGVQPLEPGLSGAVVLRLETVSGDRFVLKGWPSGTSPSRMAEAHRIAQFVRSNGCMEVPAVLGHEPAVPRAGSTGERNTVVSFHGRYWDLTQWCDGDPLPADAAPQWIALGAAAIARFHVASRKMGGHQLRPQTRQLGFADHRRVPAVASRLQRLAEIDELLPKIALAAGEAPDRTRVRGIAGDQHHLSSSIGRAVHLLLDRWPAVSRSLTQALVPFDRVRLHRQLVLRDVHREHLLFADSTDQQASDGLAVPHVTGLIDLDAARIDTPATDLARWIAGFLIAKPAAGRETLVGEGSLVIPEPHRGANAGRGGDSGNGDRGSRDQAVWQATLAAYRQISTFTSAEEQLAQELLKATVWVSLANWVDWICIQRRSFEARSERLAARIDWLLDLADNSLVR